MMTKMMMNGANWISMSVDPNGAAPLACAKAGVINKGKGSGKPAEKEEAGAARAVYIPARETKAMRVTHRREVGLAEIPR